MHGHTVTIENLLTHTSGITRLFSGEVEIPLHEDLSTDELVQELSSEQVEFSLERYKHPTASTVAMKIAALAMGDPFPERKEINLPDEIVQQYVGAYENDAFYDLILTVQGRAALHAE